MSILQKKKKKVLHIFDSASESEEIFLTDLNLTAYTPFFLRERERERDSLDGLTHSPTHGRKCFFNYFLGEDGTVAFHGLFISLAVLYLQQTACDEQSGLKAGILANPPSLPWSVLWFKQVTQQH